MSVRKKKGRIGTSGRKTREDRGDVITVIQRSGEVAGLNCAVECLSATPVGHSGGAGGSDSGSILNLVGPLLGSSSGGSSGGEGMDSQQEVLTLGSILNLVGPLLGSSSGGGGVCNVRFARAEVMAMAGVREGPTLDPYSTLASHRQRSGGNVQGDGQEGAPGGSDSGAILNLVGPLIASSSQRGQEEEAEGAPGGSDSGAILGLLGPLISSSSGVGSGGEGGDAGSGSGSILNLIGPLLGSSSGSSGGVGGDGSSGGGSDLSSILGISNSSGGGSGGGTGHSGGSDAGIGGAVNGVKVGFLQDKIQLLLRLKFGIFTKILNSLSGALAAASSPQHVPIHELKYPDP
ncbi:glycine-rich protein DOT1-like [Homalodisca vitripennis]|uniref:glycine-rich protein DOT1-like n=1 Tax=Homalodisca vitripennis TaxID=197043 RepID=UPI001EEA7E09|nr:glycine-rich protein DOT1-like [Homalodisca vitripennis]